MLVCLGCGQQSSAPCPAVCQLCNKANHLFQNPIFKCMTYTILGTKKHVIFQIILHSLVTQWYINLKFSENFVSVISHFNFFINKVKDISLPLWCLSTTICVCKTSSLKSDTAIVWHNVVLLFCSQNYFPFPPEDKVRSKKYFMFCFYQSSNCRLTDQLASHGFFLSH